VKTGTIYKNIESSALLEFEITMFHCTYCIDKIYMDVINEWWYLFFHMALFFS